MIFETESDTEIKWNVNRWLIVYEYLVIHEPDSSVNKQITSWQHQCHSFQLALSAFESSEDQATVSTSHQPKTD